MSENAIPRDLRVRLRAYFAYCRHLHRQQYYRHLLTMMTPDLRGEVSVYINSRWVEAVPFLRNIHREERGRFITALSMQIKQVVFPPSEAVVHAGEKAKKM